MAPRSDHSIDRRTRALILLLLLGVYLSEAIVSLVERGPWVGGLSAILHFFYMSTSIWEITNWFFLGVGDLVPLAALAVAAMRPRLLRPALLVIGTYAVLDAALTPLAQLAETTAAFSDALAWTPCAVLFINEAAEGAFPWVFGGLLRSHSTGGADRKEVGALLTRWFVVLVGIRYLTTVGWSGWIALAYAAGVLPDLGSGFAYCLVNAVTGTLLVLAGARLVRHRRLSRSALHWAFALLALDLLISFGFGVYWTIAWGYLGAWIWLGAGATGVSLVIATLAWYWWPVLRGREPATLDDTPTCAVCGYNLTGNTSGRCPECGAAVATSELERDGARHGTRGVL